MPGIGMTPANVLSIPIRPTERNKLRLSSSTLVARSKAWKRS